MRFFLIRLLIVFVGFTGCRKNAKIVYNIKMTTPKADSIYFLFRNKIGFRKDSVYLGNGESRVFVSAILKSGYFNALTNKSEIYSVAYNRGETKFEGSLRDSIMHAKYPVQLNSQYNLIVTMIWQKWKGAGAELARELKFQYNVLGNDTIKEVADKILIFTWPDDSASGNFTKIYDGP